MFVKTTRVRKGNRAYEYLSLVESERVEGKVRHITVARLGEAGALRESGELERIVAALRVHLGRDDDWVRVGDLDATGAPAIGAVALVDAYWSRLGLGDHYGPAADPVFAMVANRLCDPCSKRRVPEWAAEDVAMPTAFSHPPLAHYYRALDRVAALKESTEQHLYARLTDLANLDLRLVCYDITSTYFEGDPRPSDRFPSKAFGYSRDKRSDRPQIVLGLLVTGDGIPIAHHVFAGNTADVSTLPGVLDDLRERFGVGRICVVADRGFISTGNITKLAEDGFDHVLATRLHRDRLCEEALAASRHHEVRWVPVADANSAAAEVTINGTRCVVVASAERYRRDTARTAEFVRKTEADLIGLEWRVRDGDLKDAGKIGRAAQRVLGAHGVGRLFDIEISEAHFLYHYNTKAMDYEQSLAGQYVLHTSLTPLQASTAEIVRHYRGLLDVEHRFRVLKDFLHLRPIRHWTEQRVRGHVAVCVWASIIETLINNDLAATDIADPDLAGQSLTTARALRELDRIRKVQITTPSHTIDLVTRRDTLQTRILDTGHVDTTHWHTRVAKHPTT